MHKHGPIIKIYFQELMNKFLEHNHNYMREYHRHILQSKRHYSVVKTTPLSSEGCLFLVLQCDFDLVVSREPISEGVCFLATYIVQNFISEWSRERIMYASSFSFVRSTHIIISSFLFFSYITIGLTQSDSSIASMIPTTSILFSSKWTLSLYFRLRR